MVRGSRWDLRKPWVTTLPATIATHLMPTAGLTTRELATMVACSIPQARKALARLQAKRIATRQGDRWYVTPGKH